jgi:hypothetical protein
MDEGIRTLEGDDRRRQLVARGVGDTVKEIAMGVRMSGDGFDDMGGEVGMNYEDGEPLRVGEKERERDQHRWELDPASSEDYTDRLRPSSAAMPILKMGHVHRSRHSA